MEPGTLRADLYFRANVLPIRMSVPQPGRDIAFLARDFAEQVAWLWPKAQWWAFCRAPWSSSTPDSLDSRMQQTWYVNGQLWGASRTAVRLAAGSRGRRVASAPGRARNSE